MFLETSKRVSGVLIEPSDLFISVKTLSQGEIQLIYNYLDGIYDSADKRAEDI